MFKSHVTGIKPDFLLDLHIRNPKTLPDLGINPRFHVLEQNDGKSKPYLPYRQQLKNSMKHTSTFEQRRASVSTVALQTPARSPTPLTPSQRRLEMSTPLLKVQWPYQLKSHQIMLLYYMSSIQGKSTDLDNNSSSSH